MKPTKNLTEVEFTRQLRRAIALPDAPAPLLRKAVGLWPAGQPVTAQDVVRTVINRVAAVLSFDSWASAPAALGVRASQSETRHLLFSAMGRDVDLRITAAAERFALAGQVLGPDASGRIELLARSEDGTEAPGARVASLDDLGEFRLDDLSRGTYLLTLHLGGDEIALPPIEVGKR